MSRTKRGRVYYKVGDGDDKSTTISMFSALKFKLIQCLFKKCVGISASSENDFRVLFEDLVSNLMVVLHKLNWPASQLITQTLVKLLITYISGNSNNSNITILCSRYAKELSTVDNLKEGNLINSSNILKKLILFIIYFVFVFKSRI